MNKTRNKKSGIYLLFAFISIIFFYISINALYTQTSVYYDEALINNLPNAEKFVTKINVLSSYTNDNIVSIEWEGIRDDNLVYYVYRSKNPIIGKSSFSNSVVVDYVKATNDSKKYIIYDRPVISSTYYYAVVSYINDLSFYNAKENIDTMSVLFNGMAEKSESYSTNDVFNNNLNNLKYSSNFTNIVTITNTITFTNTVILTNTVTNNVTITNNSSSKNSSGNINNSSSMNSSRINNYKSSYSMYKTEYDKALAEYKRGNYLKASSILEPVSRRNVDRGLYYDINLLLGKCYKYLGRKKNSLDAFNRIKSYNTQEVNFWINQVLSDL